MRLWTIILFSCFMVLISPVCRAGDGICHAVKGTYIYNLNLNDARIPAEKIKPEQRSGSGDINIVRII